MNSFSDDAFNNIVQEGIKGDLRFCLEHQRFRAAAILAYSAIDAMAYLTMPAGQGKVTRTDFIAWTDRYVHLPYRDAPSGEEFYGARCGLLHNYGVRSQLSEAGSARYIIFAYQGAPVRFDPSIDPKLVIISLEGFANAVLAGIDDCVVHVEANKSEFPDFESRLNRMLKQVPLSKEN